jgi:hypothetical protein
MLLNTIGAFNGTQSFDSGGLLRPGWTAAYNGTGRPEAVVPVGAAPAGGGSVTEVHHHRTINISGHTAWSLRDLQRELKSIDGDRDYRAGRT